MQQFKLIANTDLFSGYSYGYKRNTLTKPKAMSRLMEKAMPAYPRIKILGFVGKFVRYDSIVRIECQIHGKVNTGVTYSDFMKNDLKDPCRYCNVSKDIVE